MLVNEDKLSGGNALLPSGLAFRLSPETSVRKYPVKRKLRVGERERERKRGGG